MGAEQQDADLKDGGGPGTLPASVSVRVEGAFASEDDARELGLHVLALMRIVGRSMDLSGVDGVTISTDYHQALASWDRGVDGIRPLSPSTAETDGAVGVAMSPAVLRDGRVKTHLIFNAHIIAALSDPQSEELFRQAIHIVAHECAHAAVHQAFDRAFPGVLLREQYDTCYEVYRQEVIDACWQEYGATRLSSRWGADPTGGYLETFIAALNTTDDAANSAILRYRDHGDLKRVLDEVLPLYARLIKWASYLIGTMHGLGRREENLPELQRALELHWFNRYFSELENAYIAIWGTWGARVARPKTVRVNRRYRPGSVRQGRNYSA